MQKASGKLSWQKCDCLPRNRKLFVTVQCSAHSFFTPAPNHGKGASSSSLQKKTVGSSMRLCLQSTTNKPHNHHIANQKLPNPIPNLADLLRVLVIRIRPANMVVLAAYVLGLLLCKTFRCNVLGYDHSLSDGRSNLIETGGRVMKIARCWDDEAMLGGWRVGMDGVLKEVGG
jgi:hypothetical protein